MTTVIHSFPVWLPQTQTWLYNQVRFLPADVACHVVCERTENLGQFGMANIHALREHSAPRYYWDKGLVKLGLRSHSGYLLERIRTLPADLVHSHFGNIAWRDMHACAKDGTGQIATFYGRDVNFLPQSDRRWRQRYRELFASVDRVLCEGPHMAASVIALGCPEEKARVHHLGVSLDDLPFKPRSWDGRGPIRVLIAGSFREKKGIPFALEALGRLQGRAELELTIIGDADRSASSQEEKRRILETIETSGLGQRVRLLGYQPYAVFLKEAYAHHLFLAPSITASDGDTEGGAPVSVIEMAATGMPVVASRHCDIPGIIEHGVSGMLAEERDVDGLVACLERLLDQPRIWPDMVTKARRHVEEEFDAVLQGQRLARIYDEIVT